MDLATLIGVGLGLFLVVGAIVTGGSGAAFVDFPSMGITLGGTVASLLITFPLAKVKATFAVAQKVIRSSNLDAVPWYSTLIDLASVARRDGLLALEKRMDELQDEFLKRGLQLVVDGNSADSVEAILEGEISSLEERHLIGHTIFKSMGYCAPAFGMVGTLIGLVQMLQNMSDPSQIGAGMAVALLTTFYGALFANLFCLPMQGKLEQRTNEEVLLKRMLLAGILSIQAGDSPRVVGEKLAVYLNPTARQRVRSAGH